MEQGWRTTAEALTALEAVMSSIDHDERVRLSAPERLVLMKRARSFEDRAVSLACVLTDEASQSSVAATGTPITSLIGVDEGRDSHDAARQVFQARDLARYAAVKEAALAGTVSSRHAARSGRGWRSCRRC
ncbi:hypothetical protein [Tessaracoccus antarcticus]|uniref:DUF222 domain-containing protein n=1 Tax=Tessaracoccus antarcticus TaxID=2479848 RepID=A0A3M0G0B9_9ACTN|nr:hypothetical protein [Tessaracoccus antarcticus]RMB58421.1 hypothetical protein EAX62_14625 [Tessaracoccus antarcticus]